MVEAVALLVEREHLTSFQSLSKSQFVEVWEVLCIYILNKSSINGEASQVPQISVANRSAPISTPFSC
jgi:hypothetical protein